MKRSYLAVLLGLLAIGVVGWLGFRTVSRLNASKETTEHRKRLPEFTVQPLDTSTKRMHPTGNRPVVLVYFNPDCEHCHYQAEQLSRHPALLKNAQVWLLSTEPLPRLQTFAKRYRLDTLPRVNVAHIEARVAFDSLGFRMVPHLLVYGVDGHLKKEFKGETRWETVEKAL